MSLIHTHANRIYDHQYTKDPQRIWKQAPVRLVESDRAVNKIKIYSE